MAQAVTNHAVKRLSVGVLACVALSACGGGGGGGGGGSTNPAPPPPSDPTPDPGMEASTAAVDFGQVVANQRVQRAIQITNTGNVDLDVTSSLATGPLGGIFDTTPTDECTNLAPNESCDVLVSFRPNAQDDFSDDVVIDSDADPITISLSGAGLGLNVQISQLSCDAGTVSGRAIVTDSFNQQIQGLAASNFTLYLNDDPQGSGIDSFTFDVVDQDLPISAGLVFDVSQSLAGSRTAIADEAGMFLDDNFDDADTAGVFQFASAIAENDLNRGFVVTDQAGRDELKNAFGDFNLDLTETTIWDSTDTVLDLVVQEPNEARSLVVLSDGQDTASVNSTLDDVIAKAAGANVPIFTIGFGDADTQSLEQLANETGGVFFAAPSSAELNATFQDIATNVTNQYDFSFPAPSSQAELTVEVLVDPDLGVDSRDIPACP